VALLPPVPFGEIRVKNRVWNACVHVAVVFSAVAVASCAMVSNGDPSPGSDPGALQPGTVSLTNNPLVAQYSISAPPSSDVEVEFGPDKTYGRKTWLQPAPTGGGTVNVFVAGMRQATTYHMRARVRLASGHVLLDGDHTFTTGTIASGMVPPVTVARPSGFSPNPGIELVDLTGGGANQLHAIALDLQGEAVWYYDFGAAHAADVPFPIKLLPNGHFLMVVAGPVDNAIREVDLAGNTIRELSRDSLSQSLADSGYTLVQNGLHHDILPLPNGHVIALVFERRTFTDLPGYPGDTVISGDALVDLDSDWKPVWTWSTFDHLDVNRHPMQFPDWTHANAVIYSPDDGDLILSMRHQNWVVKIDYRDGHGTGDILWRLGPDGDFSLTNGGPADWNYAQHYPFLMSPRSSGIFPLALFDNGNNRVVDANGGVCGGSGMPACYSRPVVFEINESAKTATIQWQDPLSVFSFCCGSIDLLPNGNMEFDLASVSSSPQTSSVREVTFTDSPRTVWQMDISNQLAYRATRLPSLYPGVQW
jgi:hypothetical protein